MVTNGGQARGLDDPVYPHYGGPSLSPVPVLDALLRHRENVGGARAHVPAHGNELIHVPPPQTRQTPGELRLTHPRRQRNLALRVPLRTDPIGQKVANDTRHRTIIRRHRPTLYGRLAIDSNWHNLCALAHVGGYE